MNVDWDELVKAVKTVEQYEDEEDLWDACCKDDGTIFDGMEAMHHTIFCHLSLVKNLIENHDESCYVYEGWTDGLFYCGPDEYFVQVCGTIIAVQNNKCEIPTQLEVSI
jgi:hypothetical protein